MSLGDSEGKLELQLANMTREQVRERAPVATVILPTAAIEQHGPHLPLSTDTTIATAIAMASAAEAAREAPIVVAPTLCFGSSHHHLITAAMSLSSETFLRVVGDLADSLVQSGFRRIFVLNGHGGNDECVRLLAKDLVLRADVAIAACSYWQAGEAAARQVGVPKIFPGHAGTFETSLMLAIAPDLVRRDAFPKEDPAPPPLSYRPIAPGVFVQKAGEWQRIGGYSDAPVQATAEAGQSLLNAITHAIAEAVLAFHRSI